MEPTGIQQANLNLQTSKIDQLKGVNFENKREEELMKAAGEFEAVFLNQLFKALDSTIERDGMFSGGRGEEMFRSMFYDETAKNISTNPTTSLGLAKQIYEQMKDVI